MKIILLVVGILVLLMAIAWLIGSRLPAAHVASRSALFNTSPSEVYHVLTDVANFPLWRADVKRVEILGRPEGHLRFREFGAHGAVTYEITREEPAHLLVTEIIDRDLGYSGSWTYELVPEGSGTRLTITERGVVTNIFFRFMSRFVFGYTKTIETYLASLSAHLSRKRGVAHER